MFNWFRCSHFGDPAAKSVWVISALEDRSLASWIILLGDKVAGESSSDGVAVGVLYEVIAAYCVKKFGVNGVGVTEEFESLFSCQRRDALNGGMEVKVVLIVAVVVCCREI